LFIGFIINAPYKFVILYFSYEFSFLAYKLISELITSQTLTVFCFKYKGIQHHIIEISILHGERRNTHMKKTLDSQAQAQLRYRGKVKQLVITFNLEDEAELALYEHLDKVNKEKNIKKASYIKSLIASDMDCDK
jgi:hypothetical protein